MLGRIRSLKGVVQSRLPVVPARQRLADKIVLVDVGAARGIQRKWVRHRHNIILILFEPNPAEAAALDGMLGRSGDYRIIPHGLSDRAGRYTLNISESFGCSSILMPNMAFLQEYEVARYFRNVGTAGIECVRYDALVAAGEALAPDVLKIDVEGYETRVLDGFGDLLHDVLGIETEAWFYPGFAGLGLLHEIVARLEGFGLRLRRLEEVPGFEGDLVCVNAYFTMTRRRYRALAPARRAKFDVMARVWGVAAYPEG